MKKLLRTVRKRWQRLFSQEKRENDTVAQAPEPVASQEQVVAGESGGREAQQQKNGRKKRRWSPDCWVVAEKEGVQRFHDFPLSTAVMHAICDLGFEYCTPVQGLALADCLAGRDLVAKANTGTGKTAVFLITIITRLQQKKKRRPGDIRALVLAPTRELVLQIGKDARQLAKYSRLSIRTVFGGTDYQKQQDLLRNGSCDLLVATPGRLLDFLSKNIISLNHCHTLVLDEADRMLDMGFIPDVRRIVGRLPNRENRQTLLFSATITDDVRRLAAQWCSDASMVEAEPEQMATEKVRQLVYLASSEEKFTVLCNLVASRPQERVIVFTNMKGEARRLSDRLKKAGIFCLLLTGDVPQQKRMARLEQFRAGKTKVLVATDVAGRGIHIDDIQLVVNFTLPYEPEDYIHRIGRTGRAGAEGLAVSFACEEGSFYLPAIEELLGSSLDCVVPEEELLQPPSLPQPAAGAKKKRRRRRPPKKSAGSNSKGRVEKQ